MVLAGDFSEWNTQSLWILDEAAKHYERVYFTVGNHDYYLISGSQQKKYGDSIGRVNEFIDEASKIKNVVPLVKNVDIYKGKMIAGDMMWYLPKTPQDWDFLRNTSNDSRYIKYSGYPGGGCPRKLHKESMDWYDTLEDIQLDLFVSHVPPVHNPFTPFPPNACYMVDVPFINTKNWICGHDHIQNKFEKAGTTFHMNAIGYAGHYTGYPSSGNVVPEGKIDEYKTFGIKTFEI